MSLIAHHHVILSSIDLPSIDLSEFTVRYDTSTINTEGYTGAAVLPLTDVALTQPVLDALASHNGGLRAWQGEQELPVEVCYCQPDWFTMMGNVMPYLRSSHMFPAAYHDAASGDVLVPMFAGFHRQYCHKFNAATQKWTWHRVGFSNYAGKIRGTDPNNGKNGINDVHNQSVVHKDAAGVYHMAGGCHTGAAAHWTSSDGETWTEQTPIDEDVTYPSFVRIGDDLAFFFRRGDYAGAGGSIPLSMCLQSVNADFQVVVDIADPYVNGPTHPSGDDGGRTYPVMAKARTISATQVDVHWLFGLHLDDTARSAPYRHHLFHAVLECSLTGGLVTGWRWKKVDGTYLAPAQTEITWTELNDPLCLMTGLSTDANAVVSHSVDGDNSVLATQWENTFTLDASGNPHMIFAVAKTLTPALPPVYGLYDVHYVRWNGAAWANSLVYPSESTSQFYCGRIDVAAANDVTVIGHRAPADWALSNWGESDTVKLTFDGSTWTEQVVELTPGSDPTALGGNGVHELPPAEVYSDSSSGPGVIVGTASGNMLGLDIYCGGMPMYLLDQAAKPIKPNKVLAYIRADAVPAAADLDIKITLDASPQAAHTAPFGTHAVWQGYDRVMHMGIKPYQSSWGQYNDPVPDSTGNAAGQALIGWLSSADAANGIFIEYFDGPVPGLYTGATNASNIELGDTPGNFANDVTGGYPSEMRIDLTLVGDFAPANTLVQMIAGYVPDQVSAMASAAVGAACNNEAVGNERILTQIDQKRGRYRAGVVDPGGNTLVDAADAAPAGAAASVMDATTMTLVQNGIETSLPLASAPNLPAFDKPRVMLEERAGADPYKYQGVVQEVRFVTGADSASWAGGRLIVETAALNRADDPSFASVVGTG
jgi:hypothetical protein